jgi:hypothetical protein
MTCARSARSIYSVRSTDSEPLRAHTHKRRTRERTNVEKLPGYEPQLLSAMSLGDHHAQRLVEPE